MSLASVNENSRLEKLSPGVAPWPPYASHLYMGWYGKSLAAKHTTKEECQATRDCQGLCCSGTSQ